MSYYFRIAIHLTLCFERHWKAGKWKVETKIREIPRSKQCWMSLVDLLLLSAAVCFAGWLWFSNRVLSGIISTIESPCHGFTVPSIIQCMALQVKMTCHFCWFLKSRTCIPVISFDILNFWLASECAKPVSVQRLWPIRSLCSAWIW